LAGLPKKYAKMGFKEGWAAYKKSKKKGKRGRRKMAKKKKSYTRKTRSTFMGVNIKRALASAVYGGLRAKTSNYLKPYTDKLPFGNVSDEAGMIIASMLAKKFVGRKIPFASELTKAAMDIEFARIGEAISTGDIGGFGSSTSGTVPYS